MKIELQFSHGGSVNPNFFAIYLLDKISGNMANI